MIAPHLLQTGQETLPRHAQLFEDAAFLDHGKQHMLDTQIVVLQRRFFVFGLRKDLTQAIGDMDLSGTAARTLYLRQLAERLIDGLTNGGKRHSGLFQQR